MREALVFAVDHLRVNGADDPLAVQAAKCLERKAERLRAKQEQSWVDRPYCDCGERRPVNDFLCPECRASVPMKVSFKLHHGSLPEMREAMRTIKSICAQRARRLEAA